MMRRTYFKVPIWRCSNMLSFFFIGRFSSELVPPVHIAGVRKAGV